MKKKFDFKLTAFLVSLFIGLLIVILGNKNDYWLSFGFIVLGLSMGIYVMFKSTEINDAIKELEDQLEELSAQEEFQMKQIIKAQNKLKRQRRSVNFVFYTCGVMFIVLGVVNLF